MIEVGMAFEVWSHPHPTTPIAVLIGNVDADEVSFRTSRRGLPGTDNGISQWLARNLSLKWRTTGDKLTRGTSRTKQAESRLWYLGVPDRGVDFG